MLEPHAAKTPLETDGQAEANGEGGVHPKN